MRIVNVRFGVLLILLIGSATACQKHQSDTGPISGGPLDVGGKQSWAVPATPGRKFTDGSNILNALGGKPFTVVSVESIGGSPSLQYLGAKVASPQRRYTTTTRFEGWPPRGVHAKAVSDAIGHVITPETKNWHGQPFELLLGYKVVSPEYGVRTGIRIVYREGGKTYQAVLHSILAACPTRQDLEACGDHAFDEN